MKQRHKLSESRERKGRYKGLGVEKTPEIKVVWIWRGHVIGHGCWRRAFKVLGDAWSGLVCLFWEVWGCLIGRCTAAWRLGEEVQDGRRALGRALKEVAGRGERQMACFRLFYNG